MSVLELPRAASGPSPVPQERRWWRPSDATAVLVGAALLYLVVGLVLVLHYDAVMEDALSRVSAAQAVVASREPKLAAIGFVWTPLPALDFLPFIWLKAVWPDLVRVGLLAVVQSALAMGFAVRVLLQILADLEVGRRTRLALTAAFALQPIIIFYGANGMTEALMIAVLLVAVRRTMLWSRDGRWQHLVLVGGALAVGYLVRYEVIAVGVAATVLVAGTVAVRERGRPQRWRAVGADAVLVGLPVLATFLAWAAVSWVVVGSPFDQLTSEYGNAALVSAGRPVSPDPTFVPLQWTVLAPLLLPVLVAALVRAWRSRDPRVLAPLLLLGAVPLFELLAYTAGSLFGFLRYQIVVVPLLAVLVGLLVAPARLRGPQALASPGAEGRTRRSSWLAVAAVAALLPGIVTSAATIMTRPDLAQQEYGRLRPIAMGLVGHQAATTTNGAWAPDRDVADELDAMSLPDGSVLVDSAMGFAVLAASEHPKRFVTTSDSDFEAALETPPNNGIRYLLICERPAVLDAVQRRWSADLAAGSVPWASLVERFPERTEDGTKWSLWQVQTRQLGG